MWNDSIKKQKKEYSCKKTNQCSQPFRALLPFDISIDGISKDHTDAAIITPAANPKSIFSNFGAIRFFKKNTMAEPRDVPIKGIANIMNSDIKAPFYVS